MSLLTTFFYHFSVIFLAKKVIISILELIRKGIIIVHRNIYVFLKDVIIGLFQHPTAIAGKPAASP